MKNAFWGSGTQTIESERVFSKNKKVFYVDRKKNRGGEFIKITEACGGHRDSIVFPVELANPICEALQRVKGGD